MSPLCLWLRPPRHATGLSRWGATLRPSSVPLPGKQSLLFWLTEEEPELTVGNSAPPLCSRTAGPGFEPKYFGLQGPTNSQPHNVPPGCLGKKPGTVGIPRPRSQHPTEGGGKVPRELGERRWLTSAPGSGMEGSGGSNSEGQSGPCGQSRRPSPRPLMENTRRHGLTSRYADRINEHLVGADCIPGNGAIAMSRWPLLG